MATTSLSGAPTPDASTNADEQRLAREHLAVLGAPRAMLGAVGGGIFASLGFGLLLVPVFGIGVLLIMGFQALTGIDLPRPDPTVFRIGLAVFGLVWVGLFVRMTLRSWRRDRDALRQLAAGESRVRTVATFRSRRFNTTEEKDTFVNPGCYGDDVVQTVLDGLAADGIEIDPEPGAEDFGWYGRLSLGENETHDVIVGFQPEDDDGGGTWWLYVERSGTPLSSNRRARGGEVDPRAPAAVHAVLTRTDGVEDLVWFHDDRQRAAAHGDAPPATPQPG